MINVKHIYKYKNTSNKPHQNKSHLVFNDDALFFVDHFYLYFINFFIIECCITINCRKGSILNVYAVDLQRWLMLLIISLIIIIWPNKMHLFYNCCCVYYSIIYIGNRVANSYITHIPTNTRLYSTRQMSRFWGKVVPKCSLRRSGIQSVTKGEL